MTSPYAKGLERNSANYTPLTPVSFLAKAAYTYPLRTAIVHGEVQRTWQETYSRCRRLASALAKRGVKRGDTVAAMLPNVPAMVELHFGPAMFGAVLCSLNTRLDPEAIAFMLDHGEAKVLFTDREFSDTVSKALKLVKAAPLVVDVDDALFEGGEAVGSIEYEDFIAPGDPGFEWRAPPDEWDAIALNYTSGTTGNPKGVMHSFATFAWSMGSAIRRVKMNPRTRMLSYLPLAHVAERTLVEHGLLASGMQVYFAESLDTFAKDLQRARPTVFFSVPRLWVKFQQGVNTKMPAAKLARLLSIPIIRGIVAKKIRTALGLDACEFAAGGAAPMPPELLAWYERLGLPIIEVYGMTENCGVSHATLPGVQRPGTVGLPYDGVQCRIDPATGEIQMKSPGLMLGYYKEPTITADAMTADGWLRTGDKGALDAEGNLRITGRVKDLFKTSKGKYVAPAPIEDKLVMNGVIEACVVTGANLGQPLGIVMLNAEAALHAKDPAQRAAMDVALKAHLDSINARLDPHEQLDCLVVIDQPWTVDNGFITPTFKVKRNRIEEVYAPLFDGWVAQRKPVVWYHA